MGTMTFEDFVGMTNKFIKGLSLSDLEVMAMQKRMVVTDNQGLTEDVI